MCIYFEKIIKNNFIINLVFRLLKIHKYLIMDIKNLVQCFNDQSGVGMNFDNSPPITCNIRHIGIFYHHHYHDTVKIRRSVMYGLTLVPQTKVCLSGLLFKIRM